MNGTHFTGCKGDDINEWYPQIEQMVASALAHGTSRVTAEDVFLDLQTGRKQAWIAWNEGVEALVVTELLDTTDGRMCSIFICTGEGRDRWISHIATIEAWAKEEGCTRMEAWARPGWERILKDYKKTHVQLEKRI